MTTHDPRVLRDALRGLAATVAATTRQEGIGGQTVILKIRSRGFETHSQQRRLDHRTNDARTLLATAWALYEAGRWHGRAVRLIGLGIGDLGTPDPVQPDLFEAAATPPADGERARRLAATLDRIEARFGQGALRRGLTGDDRETDRD